MLSLSDCSDDADEAADANPNTKEVARILVYSGESENMINRMVNFNPKLVPILTKILY